MTDEEVQKIYDEMVEMWGDRLPNPEHEPIRFGYYVRMYKFLKKDVKNDD